MTYTPANAPTVSVIIVSWNARELLRQCLLSLRTATERHAREVILVDNASTEDVTGMVREHFPEVIVQANAANVGFAAGNNLGMRIARARYLMLLNPDTELRDPGAIDALVDHLEARPDIAGAGPRLDFPDGRHQPGDAGYAPRLSAIAAHALFLSRLAPHRCRGLYLVAPSVVNGREPLPVDWLCGAATLVRRTAVDLAGGLDEAIFMYAEDIEWGCRMRSRGLALHYLPAVHVMHVGGSSEKLAMGGAVSTRWLSSLARLFLREGGRGWWLFKASLAGGFVLRSAVYATLGLLRRAPAYRVRSRLLWAYAGAAARLDRTALSR